MKTPKFLTDEKLMCDTYAVNHFHCGCHIIEKTPGCIDKDQSFFCTKIKRVPISRHLPQVYHRRNFPQSTISN